MNRVILNAFFPGEPVTWKRAGGHGSRRFNPKFMRNAQEKLRRQLRMILPKIKPDPRGRFGLQILWQISRKQDGDNLEKLLLDAFRGVIYADDEQVDEMQWKKFPIAPDKGIGLIVYRIE